MRRNWEAFSGGAIHSPYPMTYRKPKGMTDDQFGEWCLGFLEDQILRYVASPDRIAGAIFEPVALEAGVWIPPKNFALCLRKLADQHGWFFIADEVEAGLGRTGKMWGIERLGVAIGVEIVSNKGTKARDNDTARDVFFDCVRGGVIPLYDYEMNVLRIQPPLTIEEPLLDKALDGMESALRKHSR